MHSRFSNHKKKKKRNWKLLLAAALLLAFGNGAAYALFFSPYFKISQIRVEGAQKVSQDEIREKAVELMNVKRLNVLPQNTYFTFSSEKLKHILQADYLEIKEININKEMPAAITILIKERKEIMRYCFDNICYKTDEEGVLFEEAPQIYGGMNICLKDSSAREVKLGEQALDPGFINFLVKTKTSLSEKANLSLLSFEVDNHPINGITAIAAEGWKILLDVGRDPTLQVDALKRVLQEEIKEQRDNLEYVDLRVENRVYYKVKN